MTSQIKTALMAIVIGGACLGTAQAQRPSPMMPPQNPSQGPTARPDRLPGGPEEGSSMPDGGSSPSNDLSRSGGVIQPPDIGDKGVVAPPDRGATRMPVIPPPGSPGGNQNVEPK